MITLTWYALVSIVLASALIGAVIIATVTASGNDKIFTLEEYRENYQRGRDSYKKEVLLHNYTKGENHENKVG